MSFATSVGVSSGVLSASTAHAGRGEETRAGWIVMVGAVLMAPFGVALQVKVYLPVVANFTETFACRETTAARPGSSTILNS